MSWLTRLVVCGLAILFAASGVRKATGRDAGSWQVAHGVARIAFGALVVVGALRPAARGGGASGDQADSRPDPDSPPPD